MENVSITAQKSHRIKRKCVNENTDEKNKIKETNTKNGTNINNKRDVNGYYTAQLKHMCSEFNQNFHLQKSNR